MKTTFPFARKIRGKGRFEGGKISNESRALPVHGSWQPLFLIPLGVLLGVACPFLRQIFQSENRRYRASRDAGAAVNAFIRVDVELLDTFKGRFILFGMNTVHRTDIHTGSVFCANARLGNNVSHIKLLLRSTLDSSTDDMLQTNSKFKKKSRSPQAL